MTTVDFEEYRDTADDVLSRPEFREEPPSLVRRAIDWVFERLGDLAGGVTGGTGGFIFGIIIILVALAVVLYILWRILPQAGRVQRVDGAEIRRTVMEGRTRREWLAEAKAAEQEGRWDDAVHARYHALTAGLADDERLPPESSATSGEHRRSFSSTGSVDEVQVFDRVTDRYEDVWFGGDDAAEPDSRSIADADRALLGGRS